MLVNESLWKQSAEKNILTWEEGINSSPCWWSSCRDFFSPHKEKAKLYFEVFLVALNAILSFDAK
jgi:hypothetical protein